MKDKTIYYLDIRNHKGELIGHYKTDHELEGRYVYLGLKDEVARVMVRAYKAYPQMVYITFLDVGNRISKKRLRELAKKYSNIISLFY
jgi:hypothetical protein